MRRTLQLFVVGLVALLALAGTAPANADDSYYLFNGRNLTHVTTGRPEEVAAKEWQIWLFRKGAAATGNGYWGIISGRSAAAVRAELTRSQEFERKYERWCECSWGAQTNFNPLGPIAVVEAPLFPKADKLFELTNELAELHEVISQIGEVFEPGESSPFASVGAVFKEYVDNLKDAQAKLRQLRRLVDGITSPLLEQSIAQLEGLIARGDTAAPRVQRAIESARARRPEAALNGAWAAGAHRLPDGTVIKQSIRLQTGIVTVAVTATDPQQSVMSRTYSFDPGSLAVDQIRVRADGPLGWLVSVSAPGRKITDVSVSADGSVTARISALDLVFTTEAAAREAAAYLARLSQSTVVRH